MEKANNITKPGSEGKNSEAKEFLKDLGSLMEASTLEELKRDDRTLELKKNNEKAETILEDLGFLDKKIFGDTAGKTYILENAEKITWKIEESNDVQKQNVLMVKLQTIYNKAKILCEIIQEAKKIESEEGKKSLSKEQFFLNTLGEDDVFSKKNEIKYRRYLQRQLNQFRDKTAGDIERKNQEQTNEPAPDDFPSMKPAELGSERAESRPLAEQKAGDREVLNGAPDQAKEIADQEQEKRKRLIAAIKDPNTDIVIHGIPVRDPETLVSDLMNDDNDKEREVGGGQPEIPEASTEEESEDKALDLDGRTARYLLGGIISESDLRKRLKTVYPGDEIAMIPGTKYIHIDTGGRDGFVEEDGNFFLDHHGPNSKNDTSAAEILYEQLVLAGEISEEDKKYLDLLVEFVTLADNMDYEFKSDFFQFSHKTLLGLRSKINAGNFQSLVDFFKDRVKEREKKGNPLPADKTARKNLVLEMATEIMNKGELIKLNLGTESARQKTALNNSLAELKRMNQKGLIVESERYGRIAVDIGRKVGVGWDAVRHFEEEGKIINAYVSWNPDVRSFFINAEKPLDIKLNQGIKVRDRMWVKPQDARKEKIENYTLKETEDYNFEDEEKNQDIVRLKLSEVLAVLGVETSKINPDSELGQYLAQEKARAELEKTKGNIIDGKTLDSYYQNKLAFLKSKYKDYFDVRVEHRGGEVQERNFWYEYRNQLQYLKWELTARYKMDEDSEAIKEIKKEIKKIEKENKDHIKEAKKLIYSTIKKAAGKFLSNKQTFERKDFREAVIKEIFKKLEQHKKETVALNAEDITAIINGLDDRIDLFFLSLGQNEETIKEVQND